MFWEKKKRKLEIEIRQDGAEERGRAKRARVGIKSKEV